MQEAKHNSKKIYIIAGEASGDLLGSKLICELQKLNSNLEFRGVGGEKMTSVGLTSIFNMSDLSIMGFLEVIPSIPRIYERLKTTQDDIRNYKPDIIITIDSPGFNFRLVSNLRKEFDESIKIIHYVAPSVWAYKPERVHVVKALFDHLFLILPIEKEYFDKVNMSYTYIGHPIFEDLPKIDNSVERNYITIMPGSRKSEVKKHLKIFLNAASIVRKEIPNLSIFIPTLSNVKKYVKGIIKHHDNIVFSDNPKDKEKYLAKSVAAIAKSGTSSMEMIQYKIPTVVGYRINYLSYLYLKSKIKIKYASLINIILNREIIKEFLQDDLKAESLANELIKLIKDKSYRSTQLKEYNDFIDMMIDKSKPTPSQTAAKKVLEIIS